jgi:pilus assembly protein FimV
LDLLLELTKIELPEKEVESLAVTAPTVDLVEPEEPLTQETVSEPERPEVSDILDPSEIIEVLKHSEMRSPDELSIEESLFETNLTPEVHEEPMGETAPISEIQEEPLDEVTPSPELQESTDETILTPSISDTIRDSFAAASFFQDTEIKSPLEQLLEENEDKSAFQEIIKLEAEVEKEKTEVSPDSTTHTPKLFGPDDLKTASFFSDFESQEITETPQQPELEPEIKLESEPDLDQEAVPRPLIEPETESESQKEHMTEAERRVKIEKERTERKKRLWELTRGF